jgi:hypothetical protein
LAVSPDGRRLYIALDDVDEVAEAAVSISRLMLRLANAGWIPEGSIAEGMRILATEVLLTYEALRDAIMALAMNPTRVVEYVTRVHEQESKVESDGAYSAYYALMRLLTGHYETALVVGWSKGSGNACMPHSKY